ncbi:DegT/DnrJ/EryC1/StrS family aminotransferase [Parenemella sanctibonifatiensis]|uniref:Glutamine--scyllo-inositol aminotransferase n=1 Tax=Parenemella sanctibonifatiensis TaxID=2016505 RepID=A0A255E8I0_9ACTN|nr:DegT/DnrJ/EryC1/StrS family aminotransferase [Parenemella sanctibonifatiensis]OYN87878.1 glutamine--scyllo-inositol aminotransferase [Parenemella sanctibonifatiensis]
MTRTFPTTENASGRRIGEEELAAVERVIRTGHLSRVGGVETPALEEEFASLLGVKHAVASTSGSSALHLAVAGIQPEPGDEFICPPITDFGTVLGVLANGGVPVFADLDPTTGCMTVETIEAVATERTRAIMLVHLFGGAADVIGVRQWAQQRGIAVIEDCAQAYLAQPKGKDGYVGSFGDIGCFSLQQSKHITAGDGGFTITNDDDIARRMRLFSDKGWPRDTGERTHLRLGLNYRMTDLTAAVARAQLPKLPSIVGDRRTIAKRIIDAVDMPGIQLVAEPERHSFWLFPMIIDSAKLGFGHKEFTAITGQAGLPIGGGYLQRLIHQTPAFAEHKTFGESGWPITDVDYSDAAVNVPVAQGLLDSGLMVMQLNENYTTEDADYIAEHLQQAYDQLTK